MPDSRKSDVPVLLMLFARPDTTRVVFEAVRRYRPSKLFVAANGPRPDVPKDKDLCQQVRDIIKDVDWPCEVHTNFRETNIGMQQHWWKAMDWLFEHVDRGIVLEDDCVPSETFFDFCGELLTKYENEDKVMEINGSNFQFGRKRGDGSYYFSKYTHTWGWATWRRAWKKYDNTLASFPSFKANNVIDTAVTNSKERKYWMKFFESIHSGFHNGSDVKWLYSIWANEGLCITPNVNMVSNIGHGVDAGHTVIKEKTMGQKSLDIKTIVHPSLGMNRDKVADGFTFEICFHRTFLQKVFYKIAFSFSKIFG